ncbi:MAG: hypothetical protein ACP5GX_09275 [Anaerolineae bacterium]
MGDAAESDKPLFRSGKASWLTKKGARSLDADQRAILLALTRLDAELGRDLTPEEEAALDTLNHEMGDSDAQRIAQAIQEVVEAPADPKRKTSWAELKKKKR